MLTSEQGPCWPCDGVRSGRSDNKRCNECRLVPYCRPHTRCNLTGPGSACRRWCTCMLVILVELLLLERGQVMTKIIPRTKVEKTSEKRAYYKAQPTS